MDKISTIATHRDVIQLARTYCSFNGLKLKDYVAKVLEDDLKEFSQWMKKECKV